MKLSYENAKRKMVKFTKSGLSLAKSAKAQVPNLHCFACRIIKLKIKDVLPSLNIADFREMGQVMFYLVFAGSGNNIQFYGRIKC